MGLRISAIVFLCFVNLVSGFGQSASKSLIISPITSDFYVFTTYNLYKGARIGANGMYLVTDGGVVLFDSPWDTTQFQPLLDTIRARHGKDVVLCLATHFHEDRTGGLEYYRNKGIRTYTTVQTDSLSRIRGMKRAAHLIYRDTTFNVGQYSFRTYYPGRGHAPDNIVVWFEKDKILYGGCLIKSVEDSNLGNLGDADPMAYAMTIKNVQRMCPKPAYIITGHNDYRSNRSLHHTLKMAKALKKTIR